MFDDFKKIPKKKSSNNYKLLYFEASYFLHASLILKKHTYIKSFEQKEIDLSIGMQYAAKVNHAYAFELYIKCIMVIENKEYFSGHHLLKLFNKLNNKTKKEILEIYENEYTVFRRNRKYFGIFDKISFIDLLNEVYEPFVDLRYNFDNNKNNSTYDLWDAINCLIIYIKRIKPDIEDD